MITVCIHLPETSRLIKYNEICIWLIRRLEHLFHSYIHAIRHVWNTKSTRKNGIQKSLFNSTGYEKHLALYINIFHHICMKAEWICRVFTGTERSRYPYVAHTVQKGEQIWHSQRFFWNLDKKQKLFITWIVQSSSSVPIMSSYFLSPYAPMPIPLCSTLVYLSSLFLLAQSADCVGQLKVEYHRRIGQFMAQENNGVSLDEVWYFYILLTLTDCIRCEINVFEL